jgi:transcriptional regulator with XRE-family HTH domain
VDNRVQIREFLASRRARITPDQAGLPDYGAKRRVTGLRREEVAMLAGVSVDYYTRLERGHLGGASESVLEALAQALQLDDIERSHLFDLARTANSPARARRRPKPQPVRPSLQRILDSMGSPAWVRNGRMDFLAANSLGLALYSEVFNDPARPVNTARFAFLNPRATEFYADWERTATDLVGILQAEAGRNPYDPALTALIGELSTRSEEFRRRWAAHDVHAHIRGTKRINHPVVGRLELAYEAMELSGDSGQTLLAYTAEPGSPSQDALSLLASWSVTTEPAN